MIKALYATNHRQRREQALLAANNQCQHCSTRFGVMRLSRAFNLKFETPHLHHPNGDPENPDAEVIILCDACHMRAHRRAEAEKARGKAPQRKTGYEIVRMAYLLERLEGAGLTVQPADGGQVAWRLGELEGVAEISLDAVLVAFHWMASEVRDLTDKLELSKR